MDYTGPLVVMFRLFIMKNSFILYKVGASGGVMVTKQD